MEMPKPSPGHQRLQALVGRWEGEETMHPSQWDPAGGVAVGRTSSRLALNGLVVITNYEQERDGAITFAGHGVWHFDADKEVYILHWFDFFGQGPEVFTGVFEDEVLTASHAGPGTHMRLTYDLSEAGHLRSSMEMSKDGSSWTRMFDGHYERLESTG